MLSTSSQYSCSTRACYSIGFWLESDRVERSRQSKQKHRNVTRRMWLWHIARAFTKYSWPVAILQKGVVRNSKRLSSSDCSRKSEDSEDGIDFCSPYWMKYNFFSRSGFSPRIRSIWHALERRVLVTQSTVALQKYGTPLLSGSLN
jgi:hypothetical protein